MIIKRFVRSMRRSLTVWRRTRIVGRKDGDSGTSLATRKRSQFALIHKVYVRKGIEVEN